MTSRSELRGERHNLRQEYRDVSAAIANALFALYSKTVPEWRLEQLQTEISDLRKRRSTVAKKIKILNLILPDDLAIAPKKEPRRPKRKPTGVEPGMVTLNRKRNKEGLS